MFNTVLGILPNLNRAIVSKQRNIIGYTELQSGGVSGMPVNSEKDEAKQYIHDEQKKLNNPPVGLATAETDQINGRTTYLFDPHLDPQLQWVGH